MILYHGTHKKRYKSILKNGLQMNGGFISLAFQKDVAFGYASMSGEKAFVRNRRAKHIPPSDRMVLVIEISDDWQHEIHGSGLLPNHEYRIFQNIPSSMIKEFIFY